MVDTRFTTPERALPVAALVALAALMGLAAPAAADPPAAYGARRAAGVTFRDWRLACMGEDCEVRAEVAAVDGTPLLSVAADPLELTLRTALPLFLPDGVVIELGDAPLRTVPWRTCGRDGCVATAPVDPGLLAGLKRERRAEATIALVDGVRIRLPVSLLGFTAAWEEMAARLPPPAPAPPEPAPRPAAGPGDAAPDPGSGAAAGPGAGVAAATP